MTIEQWVLWVFVPAAAGIWGLVKVIGPRLSDAFIRKREATTEQMAKLIERQLDQNSLMTSYVTEKHSADIERLSDEVARMNKHLVAVETLTRLLVYFVAQLSDGDKAIVNNVLREMIGGNDFGDVVKSRDTQKGE